jgi:15-cis-phytoene synthase
MSALADLVKQADPDRYIATLFAPADKRDSLFALYAFDAEISRIVDLAHDPLPGEIRLQWWRDVANGERDGEAAGHPVASALLQTVATHDLPRSAFDAYCEARIFDFYHDVMPDCTALEAYLGATHSAIFQLAVMILNRDAAKAASDAAGHAGVAQGIARILCRLPVILARGQGYVPQDILDAAGISQDVFLAGGNAAGSKRVTDAMSALSLDHFTRFQRVKRDLPKQLLSAFLPIATVPRLLRAVDRLDGQAALHVSHLGRMWDIVRTALHS